MGNLKNEPSLTRHSLLLLSLINKEGCLIALDDVLVNNDLADIFSRWKLIHGIEQGMLKDGS